MNDRTAVLENSGSNTEDPFGLLLGEGYPAFLREVLRQRVSFSPTLNAYLVARHEDLCQVLDDPVTFSMESAVTRLYDNPPEVVSCLREGGVAETRSIINHDPEDHRAVRQLVASSLSGARVRRLIPAMKATASELIDGFSSERAEGVDLVSRYATPFVRTTLNTLIGYPAEDCEQIDTWIESHRILLNPHAAVSIADKYTAAEAVADYSAYIEQLIARRRTRPETDYVSDLVQGGMPHDEIVTTIRDLGIGGFDNPRNAIPSVIFQVLQSDTLRAYVVKRFGESALKVVEETLRNNSPLILLARTVARDTEVGGTPLARGSRLLVLFGAGNRDSSVFPDPDTFDVERSNLRDHLGFGFGPHACPGAGLARSEIRIALETLLKTLPTVRLSEGRTPAYLAELPFLGLDSLYVTW